MLAIVPHTSSITDARPADEMIEAACRTTDASLRRGADRKLADPYKIGLLLFWQDPWDVFRRPIAGLRYIVTERLRVMRSLAGTRFFDGNELLGLREADLALSDDRAWAKAMERWR